MDKIVKDIIKTWIDRGEGIARVLTRANGIDFDQIARRLPDETRKNKASKERR